VSDRRLFPLRLALSALWHRPEACATRTAPDAVIRNVHQNRKPKPTFEKNRADW
jgi:hypothetical protein